MVSQKNLGFWYTMHKGKKLRNSKKKSSIRESKKLSKKTSFLRVFQKIVLFVCVFCAFFISPVFATLPAGYTELEYIESTGMGQYINTGVSANLQTSAEVAFSLTDDTGYPAVFGGRVSITSNAFNLWAKSPTATGGISINYDGQGAIVNSGVVAALDTKYKVYFSSSKYVINDTETINITGVNSFTSPDLWLFDTNGGSTSTSGASNRKLVGKIYSCKIWVGDTLVRYYIPAKHNSDNVLGMYDTVSGTFFTNQGTGDFIAGPIKYRNLFNKDNYMKTSDNLYVPAKGTGTTSISSDGASPYLVYIPVEPNATYSVMNFYSSVVPVRLRGCFTESVPAVGVPTISNEGVSAWDGVTPITLTNNSVGKYLVIQPCNASQLSQWDDIVSGLVVVENSVAPTSYVPYEYSTTEFGIKIATTKYVDEEFAAAEAELATTVQTIESVVSRTITQTGQIQVLQDTKQTRPDESCPANMKCLLVQDEDGTPHWYPIIEP
ncbi:MAG: hypothetical protein MJ164_02380 [Alphaproteobacteria bacterium]|nr:hypothetical protein [Alphaproteobacteria bacterium]